MGINELKDNWNQWAEQDPMWAICTEYSKRGNKWNEEEFFASGQEEIENLMLRVESVCNNLNRMHALDFGCGIGRLTQAFANHFEFCVGVDISEKMVQLARDLNKYGERCEYVLNECDNLSQFNDHTFDLVYCSRVLQHIPPPIALRYIGEFVRILKPSGLAVFQVPSAQHGIKSFVKKLVPMTVVNAMRQVVYRSSAVIEMHTINRDEVIDKINKSGGSLLAVDTNQAAGADYTSYLYYATGVRSI